MSRRRRTLSPEEAALWERVAENTRALHARKPATAPAPPKPPPKAEPGAPPEPTPEPSPRFDPFRIGQAAARAGPGHVLRPGIAEQVAGQPLRMDHRAFGKMKRGKLRPEGKIDLHGMTLAQAHPALIRYVLSAQGAGKRLILVVTGKGRDRDEDGPIPTPRGVLKHQVPAWLAQPPLAAVVLQVAEAHRSHGGGGAWYVYLRRQPGGA